MAYKLWSAQEKANLVSEPLGISEQRHPQYTRNHLYTLRRYYIKQLRGKDMEVEPTKNVQEVSELLEPFGLENLADVDVSYHVGYIKNADGEIEYTKPLPSVRARAGRNTQQLSDFISQADPVNITPSKRKPINRDHKLIVAFSDSQIDYREIDGKLNPIHDERALEVVRLMCQALRPDTIVNLGDTIDLSALSRFDKDSTHFDHSMQPAFNRVHRLYAELRADNPLARIVEVDSNHNTRLKKFMLKNASALYGLKQAGAEHDYPVMSYPYLANLGAVGVEWVSGYGGAELVYGEEYNAPPIIFKHGMYTGVSVTNKEAIHNPETHVVRGHTHRPEVAHRTMRNGTYLTYMVVGVTCSITGDVPSVYSSVDDRNQVVRTQEKWQQSLAVIHDYQDGTYQFDNVMIHSGIAKYNGKVYDGNE